MHIPEPFFFGFDRNPMRISTSLWLVNKGTTHGTYGKMRASSSKLSCQQVKQSKHNSIQKH
jgi:hypothetical protein